MTAAPEGWLVILVGFILFRLLDAVKPWPISWLDRSISGGMGIMVDDVAAGIVALAILQGLLYFQFL
jgi:phosphatidylglycerophosphatase A